jgi:ankyrin repeat protein
VDLTQFLVEHGADVTVQNKDRGSLLHMASERGNLDFAQFLVEHLAPM